MILVWPLHFVINNMFVEQDVDDQTIETTRYSRDMTHTLVAPRHLNDF